MEKNVNFWEWYLNLERETQRELRKEVCENCGIEPTTFYTWLQKRKVPKWQIVRMQIIAQEFAQLHPDTINPDQQPTKFNFTKLQTSKI